MADNSNGYYGYSPNEALPIVAAAIYGLSFVCNLYIAVRTKSLSYSWAFIIGCLGETIGYGARRASATKPDVLGLFLAQELPTILAPAFLAASLYQVFGRLVIFVGERFSPIRPTRVTKIFVVFDVLSFFIQSGGGGLFGSDKKSIQDLAKIVLIIGFVVQIVSFGIFFIFSIIYYRRTRSDASVHGRWERLLKTLWILCVLILIRSIFRCIEFADGGHNTGALQTREWLYYTFETLPILVTVHLFFWLHPSRYIPANKSQGSTSGGSHLELLEQQKAGAV